MENRKGLLYGLGAALLILLGVFALRSGEGGLLGFLGKTVLLVLGIVLLLVAAIVILVVVLAFRSSKNEQGSAGAPASTSTSTSARKAHAMLAREEQGLLDDGRRALVAARQTLLRMEHPGVRQSGNQTCDRMEALLKTLREKPETIQKARRFLNYHIPALQKLLAQFRQMEQNQVTTPQMAMELETCLNDLCAAAEQRQKNLFDYDIIDLTAEMDVLRAICQQEALGPGPEEMSTKQN